MTLRAKLVLAAMFASSSGLLLLLLFIVIEVPDLIDLMGYTALGLIVASCLLLSGALAAFLLAHSTIASLR